MSAEREKVYEPNHELFCSDLNDLDFMLSESIVVQPRRSWNYGFNENDVATVISNREPYIELYIESTKPWTHKHICYMRAKLEYHAHVVRHCLEPLKSEMLNAYGIFDVEDWLYPMISLIYSERLGLDSCRMLFDLSMQWQQEGIPHSFCFPDNRERQYKEILWERPDPLTPIDFIDVLNRSNEISLIDRVPPFHQSEWNVKRPSWSSNRT